MKRHNARTRGIREEKGQTLVEFALILPLLILLMIATIEFSVILYDQAAITGAARVAARLSGLYRVDPNTGDYKPYTTAEIQQAVTAYLNNQLVNLGGSSTPAMTPLASITEADRGQIRTVTVSYPYSFLLLPKFITLGETINLTSHAEGVIE